MDYTDVVVVGAGPAGSSAAASFATSPDGPSVTVVDRAEFPRDKACGDGLGPWAVRTMRDLGVGPDQLEGSRRIETAEIHGPGSVSFTASLGGAEEEQHGYVVRRQVLDASGLIWQHGNDAYGPSWPGTCGTTTSPTD